MSGLLLPGQSVIVRLDDPIESYDDLRAMFVARRHELGWSQIEVDERAGWAANYCSKLECGMRIAGALAMPIWFQVLGVRLARLIVEPVSRVGPQLDGAALNRRPRRLP